MKIVKGIKSQSKPIEIDDTSSSTTVFVRYNIEESTEVDPVFKTENTVYTYDEYQYSFPEWLKVVTDGIQETGKELQNSIDVTQLAIVEILDIIYSPMTMNLDNEDDTDFINTNGAILLTLDDNQKYSAIVRMYGSLINRKLLTIDKVPSTFLDEIKKYLDDNKE